MMGSYLDWLLIIVVLNMIAGAGGILFFYYRRLEVLEGYLQGIQCIEWRRAVCGDGFLGRQLRFSVIVMIVVMPKLFYKRGEIPKDADKRIPAKLRNQLKALSAYVALTMFAMVALYFTLPEKPGN